MTEAQMVDLALPHLRMSALTWGPEDGRLALCLHGFPDSAWSWRKLGPLLADRGFRVVAPFTRGYSPSDIPDDHDFHIGALAYDALAIHEHLGSPEDAVLIGHDWGAITTNAIAAYPRTPFSAHITMSVPPVRAMKPFRHRLDQEAVMGVRQLRMSWYIMFFQLPQIPQRVLTSVIPRLWRDWSPSGFPVDADIATTLEALPTRAHREAAIGYYRAPARPGKPAPRYAELQPYAFALPEVPVLHFQGAIDGAVQLGYLDGIQWPVGSRLHVLDGAGHFVQVEQPAEILGVICEYLGV